MPSFTFTLGMQTRTVTSSKTVTSTKGIYIYFEDGASLNMLTGAIVANGPTDIIVDPEYPKAVSPKLNTYSQEFDAQAILNIGSIPDAIVLIRRGESKTKIKVDITSEFDKPESRIFFTLGRGTMTIAGVVEHSLHDGENPLIEPATEFSNIYQYKIDPEIVPVLFNNDEILSQLIAPPTMTIVIWVPRSIDLKMVGVWNEVSADEIGGFLEVHGASLKKLSFDGSYSANIINYGINQIYVASVPGELYLTGVHTGPILIGNAKKQGHHLLRVHSHGTGAITIFGLSETATVTLTGSGYVNLGEVRTEPRVARSGTGSVAVNNWSNVNWSD